MDVDKITMIVEDSELSVGVLTKLGSSGNRWERETVTGYQAAQVGRER